jgi:hypothetical protein
VADNPAQSLAQFNLSALFQRRKRLGDDGLVVVEKAAPKRHGRHEDRQNGDQTHTHTSPLTKYAYSYRLILVTEPKEAHPMAEMVAELPQTHADDCTEFHASRPLRPQAVN